MTRQVKLIRFFAGKRFRRRYLSFTKREADRLANDLRKEEHLVRVTKLARATPVWEVWQGPKRK